MHIQYTKININRDMASFARYETNGFEIQTKVTYVIPLKYKRASKKPSKTLHKTSTVVSDILSNNGS